MHLFNCLNPVTVYKDGVPHFYPCGKCDYCRYVRSEARSRRLTDELKSHRFACHVTLTYSDAFLPLLHHDFEQHISWFAHDDGNLDNYHDCVDGLMFKTKIYSKRENDLIRKYIAHYGGIPVLSKMDAQKFIKRLRINIQRKLFNKLVKNNLAHESEKEAFKITYAICGEYGPSVYRPHYHFLCMFDRIEILQSFKSLLYSSWEFGLSTYRIVNVSSEDGKYVAKYANTVNRLPSFYTEKMVAPFYLCSKASTFGCAPFSEKEIQRVYRESSPEIVRSDNNEHVPLPVFLENRLFPRFTGFNSIPYRTVYDLLRQYQTEVNTIHDAITLFNFNCSRKRISDIGCYYNMFAKGTRLGQDDKFRLNAAKSLFYCSRKYRKLMMDYGLTLSECLERTYNFLYRKDMLRLKEQFELEDSVMRSQPEHFDYINLRPVSESVMLSTEFGKVVNHVRLNIDHSHKNKRKREYLAAHPEYNFIHDYDSDCINEFSPFTNF